MCLKSLVAFKASEIGHILAGGGTKFLDFKTPQLYLEQHKVDFYLCEIDLYNKLNYCICVPEGIHKMKVGNHTI